MAEFVVEILEHPQMIESGDTARFRALFRSEKGNPIRPSSLEVRFYEGDLLLAGPLAPVEEGNGSYRIDFTIPSSWRPGFYVVEWRGSYSYGSEAPRPIVKRGTFQVKKTSGV